MFPRNTSLATFLVILSTMSICWTVADALYIVKNREMMAAKKSSDEYGQDAIKEAAILQQQKKGGDSSNNLSDIMHKMREEEKQVEDSVKRTLYRQEKVNQYLGELEMKMERRGSQEEDSGTSNTNNQIAKGKRDTKNISDDLNSLVAKDTHATTHGSEVEDEKKKDHLQGEALMKKLAKEDATAEIDRHINVVPSEDESEAKKKEDHLQGEALMKKLAKEDAKAEIDRHTNAVPSEDQIEVHENGNRAEKKEVQLQGEELIEKLAEKDEKAQMNRIIEIEADDLEGDGLMRQLEKDDKKAQEIQNKDESEAAENVNEALGSKDNTDKENHGKSKGSTKERDQMIERLSNQSKEDNRLLGEMIAKLRNGQI